MSLQTKIETKLNEALKAQDKKTYSTLRLVVAAIKDTMIAKKVRDKKTLALLDDNSRKILSDFMHAIKSANFAWDSKLLNEFINTYCEESSLKFRDIGIPLRIALTGSTSSPSIVHIMEILGEHQTLDRLNIIVD